MITMSSWNVHGYEMCMHIHQIHQCSISMINHIINIIWWIQYWKQDMQISKKNVLVNRLIFPIGNTFTRSRLFMYLSMLLKKCLDPDPPLFKLSSSPEMTRSKSCPWLCFLSCECYGIGRFLVIFLSLWCIRKLIRHI